MKLKSGLLKTEFAELTADRSGVTTRRKPCGYSSGTAKNSPRINSLRLLSALSLLLLTSNASVAQSWAERMVTTRKIDFGFVATGSEAKKLVEVRNVHRGKVNIASVSTTCGCSAAALDKQMLEPGETTFVEVKMNTQKFRQKKDSNLIITFDYPEAAEVRIPIEAYIRTDVVFNPGAIRFNNVEAGKEATAEIDIAYAGRANWDVLDIKIPHRYVKATLSVPKREDDLLKLRLTVTLSPAAPPGRIRSVLTLVTNDAKGRYIPLMIEGNVSSDIGVSPRVVNVPTVSAGDTARVQFVLRSKRPVQIEDISCRKMPKSFSATLPEGAKPVHVVPLTFTAPSTPGRFSEEILVKVAGRAEPIRVPVTGTVR